jgi:hypothetical protein
MNVGRDMRACCFSARDGEHRHFRTRISGHGEQFRVVHTVRIERQPHCLVDITCQMSRALQLHDREDHWECRLYLGVDGGPGIFQKTDRQSGAELGLINPGPMAGTLAPDA